MGKSDKVPVVQLRYLLGALGKRTWKDTCELVSRISLCRLRGAPPAGPGWWAVLDYLGQFIEGPSSRRPHGLPAGFEIPKEALRSFYVQDMVVLTFLHLPFQH